MTRSRRWGRWRCAAALALPLLAVLAVADDTAVADWPQWGGPQRDFRSPATGLASRWPESGPPRRWTRPLGEGYSALAAADGRLYTQLREADQEVVVCLDGASGETLWRTTYDAPFSDSYVLDQGPGPHATPTVAGRRLFTAGATGLLYALDRSSGAVLWHHDLVGELGGTVRPRGYATSPLAYRDLVIVQVGGPGQGVVAFRQADGTVAWRGGDCRNSASSPILIQVDGEEQLVAFTYGEVVGLDPLSGKVLWTHPHPAEYGLNVSTPLWGDDQVLFVSSDYGGGGRGLALHRSGGVTRVEELWYQPRMRITFTNALRLGDTVYGSSGSLLSAVDVASGSLLWRDRRFARANLLYADGHAILLDERGRLALATLSREGLEVTSQLTLPTERSWTVPTLAGTTLYVRDRVHLWAFDLAAH